MKTFLLSIPESLRQKSETLDIKAILCSKSWEIFNDDGIKQVFIFKKDGRLIVSTAGDVTNSSWEYVSANRGVIIKGAEKASLFHLAYADEAILALGKDGSMECLFMIDEMNRTLLSHRSLQELTLYFLEKEQKLLKEEEDKKKIIEAKKEQDDEIAKYCFYALLFLGIVMSIVYICCE